MCLKTNVVTKLVLLLNLALLLTFSPAAASETADWRMVLYNPIDHSLFALTQDGITETWALPPDMVFVALSPSEEFAVLREKFRYGNETHSATIFNLKTGECCEALVTAETFLGEENFSDKIFRLSEGGFDDTGMLFAFSFSFLAATTHDQSEGITEHGVAVVNVQTRELVNIAPNDDHYLFGAWIGDEIGLYPVMTYQQGVIPPLYQEITMWGWDPLTGEIRDLGLPVVFLRSGDRTYNIGEFLVTGEYIFTSFIEASPGLTFATAVYNEGSLSSFPVWFDNYPFGGGSSRLSRNSLWISDGSYMLNETARWISDGRYLFNRVDNDPWGNQTTMVQILSRNGMIDEIKTPNTEGFLVGTVDERPTAERFLAGTPNGWIAIRRMNYQEAIIVEYLYDNGFAGLRQIAAFPDPNNLYTGMKVIKPMSLGASLTDSQSFPQVQPPMLGLG